MGVWHEAKRVPSKGLRERLGSDDIISVLQQNRLQWYGHVLRKEDNDWLKKCMEYEVEGARPRGRPKETWRDCQACKLNREDAHTHTHTHTHNRFMALWNLSGTTRVSRYQKKHSPTDTHRGHQSSCNESYSSPTSHCNTSSWRMHSATSCATSCQLRCTR